MLLNTTKHLADAADEILHGLLGDCGQLIRSIGLALRS